MCTQIWNITVKIPVSPSTIGSEKNVNIVVKAGYRMICIDRKTNNLDTIGPQIDSADVNTINKYLNVKMLLF